MSRGSRRRSVAGRHSLKRGAQLAVAGVGAVMLAAATAAAQQDEGEAIRLEYSAPSGCPSREEFVDRVRARTGRARIASVGEAARTFTVALSVDARAVSGNVTIRERDGHPSKRDVQGSSCADVADVLSLVVALAIDPEARITPSPPLASSSVPARAPLPAPAPAPVPVPVPVPAPPAAPPTIPRARQALPPRSVSRWGLSAGAQLSVSTSVTPNTMFGAAVFVEARPQGDGLLAPALRVGFERASSGTIDVGGGSNAQFTWTVGRLDACALLLRRAPFGVYPCARIEVGTLEGTGAGIEHARSALRPWIASGPLVRARWTILAPLFLDLEVGAMVAIVRDRFFFEPQATIYEVPSLGGTAGAAIGASFF